MDTTTIVILVVLAVVIVVLASRYRDRIKFALKGPLGMGLDFEGQNPSTDAARSGAREPSKSAASPTDRSRTTTASGEGSVAVGGDARESIVTGDKNKVG